MSPAAQTAADLRTLVLRRVGEKKRVVLLAPDPVLTKALEAAGCTVLEDPASLERVQDFGAQVVIAFDGLIERGRGDEVFAALVLAAPKAQLLFSFANCAAASGLLAGLLGHPQPAGLAEAEVRRWFAAAGLEVVAREVVVMPHAATGLSADTEAALRQLLEQLNPDAGVDRVLLTAQKGKATAVEQPERVAGLVSVLVVADGDALALDATLASLSSQAQRPLELVCAVGTDAEGISRVLKRASEKDGVVVRPVTTGAVEPARMANLALARATGQYLALFRAGDVADKGHLSRLAQALSNGTTAWAHAQVARPGAAPSGAGSALERLAAGQTEACGWLLDRDRLGTFPVVFADGTPAWESLLFARLLTLFAPTLAGATGAERTRIPLEPVAELSGPLQARPLRVLTSLAEALRLAQPATEPPPSEMLARALGRGLEEKAPALYASLKRAAKRVID